MIRILALRSFIAALALGALAGSAAAWPEWSGQRFGDGLAPWGAVESRETGFVHSFEGRFGLVYERDSITGESRTSPVADMLYTVGWRHQLDNGMRFQVSVGVGASNFTRDRHWSDAPRR